MKSLLVNINEVSQPEWLDQLEVEQYNQLMSDWRTKTPITIDCVNHDLGGAMQDNYFSITLSDGTEIDSIGGGHLSQSKLFKDFPQLSVK